MSMAYFTAMYMVELKYLDRPNIVGCTTIEDCYGYNVSIMSCAKNPYNMFKGEEQLTCNIRNVSSG